MKDRFTFDNLVENPNEYSGQELYPNQNRDIQYRQFPTQYPTQESSPFTNPAQYPTQYPTQYPGQYPTQYPAPGIPQGNTKFCKHCGQRIAEKAVICPLCGCQVEEFAGTAAAVNQPIIINNNNNNNNSSAAAAAAAVGVTVGGKRRDKWVAFFLCLFLGYLGAHKFYEGKILSGILYLCTFGLACFGIIIDLIAILMKPNPYYV